MTSGVRVSLDLDIRSRVVAAGIGYDDGEVRLNGGVLEVKGT